MIGGYVHSEKDRQTDELLRSRLDRNFRCLDFSGDGILFFTDPFQSEQKSTASAGGLTALSEDLLVARDSAGDYRFMDLETGFLAGFERQGPSAFNSIHSDFRMAVISLRGADRRLFLASQRAGSGRIYYHKLRTGMVFCSDLRFLVKIVPFEISRKAVYALLKYGSIPEPLTIGEQILAVPSAHYLEYRIPDGKECISPYFKYRFPADTRQFEEKSSLGGVRQVLRATAKFLGNYRAAMLLSGGIDSSLYGCYLNEEKSKPFDGFYCSFGQDDPERPYACAIAKRLGVELHVATMVKDDAVRALDDVVRLTDHPFSDFSSLPIVFLVQYIRDHQSRDALIIECNGGDDCFGFPALKLEWKFRLKHFFPGTLKKGMANVLANASCWKWESSGGFLARISPLADVHEKSVLNYFLVQAPVNYLGMNKHADWDDSLHEMMEQSVSNCGQDYAGLSYEAKTTLRQLFFINSARWAAKAFSVGESLGRRVIYPFIWHDVLVEQGKLPWNAKVRDGVIKWPLKRLLEEYMPADFIYRQKSGFVPPFVRWLTDPDFNDKVRGILLSRNTVVSELLPAGLMEELLIDARAGVRLRSPILNLLWGALFTESWIQEHKPSR